MIMVGNRFSYNGYSYTRAPTLDWGHAPNGAAPTGHVRQGLATESRGRRWSRCIAVASNLGLRDWGFALAAFAPPGASRFEFPASRDSGRAASAT